ncbi:MAG TPA: hypothetical protein VH969_13075 [Actinophytocola sp.]|jgi:hypothetical protein|uniref:hypothetical protein n=1 Tax=Actinophytocola sp. TaxID=1872138 RepID=UPI002F935CFB
MLDPILRGMAAGAAGTTALNAVTYLDMLVRGRPASSTPEQSVARLADRAHVEIPEQGRDNRVSAAGALLGLATGVLTGAAYGAARAAGWRPSLPVAGAAATLGAMVGASAPMAVMGVSDPREWSATDWVADAVPHAAYGLVTAATYAAMAQRRRTWRSRHLSIKAW